MEPPGRAIDRLYREGKTLQDELLLSKTKAQFVDLVKISVVDLVISPIVKLKMRLTSPCRRRDKYPMIPILTNSVTI